MSPEDVPLTQKICKALGAPMCDIDRVEFKNGVPQPELLESVRGKFAVLIQTTYPNPKEKFTELQLTLDAARASHAKFILAVIPYTPFARSDKKDRPRIGYGFRAFAEAVDLYANSTLLCDLHNDATGGYFKRSDSITARELLFHHIKKHLNIEAVLALDTGSVKRSQKMANALNVPYGIMDKKRKGNTDSVEAYNIFGLDVRGKNVLAIEDEVSTGGSLVMGAELSMHHGASKFYGACSHGVLCDEATKRICTSPITQLITTNTVCVPDDHVRKLLVQTKKIVVLDMAPIFAEAIRDIYLNIPMGKLFDYGESYPYNGKG